MFIKKIINFQQRDIDIIQEFMKDKGLTTHGFSAAVRIIIRDYDRLAKLYYIPANQGGIQYPTKQE